MLRLVSVITLILFSFPGVEAADLYGIVKRPPAVSQKAPIIPRYREAHIDKSEPVVADCGCNPGLFSVISLYTDSLMPTQGSPDTLELKQHNKMFEPSVMAVTVNSTVSFPNLDPFYHNVFSYSKTKRFDLGKYKQGETKDVTFDRPGIVQVFCEIHYSMRAYIHVLQTPYFAVSDERGSFVIHDIPPGRYNLKVWQESQTDIYREINIAGDSTMIEVE